MIKQIIFFCAVIFLTGQSVFCQVKIRGTVFDITQKRPLEGVSVISNLSGATVTDVLGNYTILVDKNDSIYFSYLGKPTPKYAVKALIATNNFDISLHVESNILPEVIVRPRSYRMDSLQNRLDYAKVFNYSKPRLGINSTSSGVGVDLDGLIDIFRIRKKKNMLAFQERLVQQEQDKYVDHRFNKALVRKITNLEGAKLDSFMKLYRPSYFFTANSTDYDFLEYIKQNAARYREVFVSEEK